MIGLLAAAIANGEPRSKRLWRWSVAAVVAGSTLDIASSYGAQEANPLLRGSGGRFDGRSIALRGGIAATSLLLQRKLMKARPDSQAPTIVNFATAGALGGIAIHNWKVR